MKETTPHLLQNHVQERWTARRYGTKNTLQLSVTLKNFKTTAKSDPGKVTKMLLGNDIKYYTEVFIKGHGQSISMKLVFQLNLCP